VIKPVELFIGLRYTRAKRRNHFISFISFTSMAGIALGVWALITVISVMNGFGSEIRTRLLEVASHATVTVPDGPVRDWQGVARILEQDPEVVGVAPYVDGQGLLAMGGRVSGSLLRGVLPERESMVADFQSHMLTGRLSDLKEGQFDIILGVELAYKIGARVGDKVTVVLPEGQVTPAGLLPRLRRFTVVGIFEIGHYLYDSGLALIHLDDASRLLRLEGGVSGVRIKLADVDEAPRLSPVLAKRLGGNFRVRDWTRDNVNYFRALKIEKTVMFIILSLIVAVAAFNIVSTLVMLVTDKQADIAILRTLGMSPRGVMAVFMVQGAVIGTVGTVVGSLVGIFTALNIEWLVPAIEHLIGTRILAPDLYYITELPSEMRWSDVSLITGASMLMGLLATLYPAWRASRTQPAEALRYE